MKQTDTNVKKGEKQCTTRSNLLQLKCIHIGVIVKKEFRHLSNYCTVYNVSCSITCSSTLLNKSYACVLQHYYNTRGKTIQGNAAATAMPCRLVYSQSLPLR